MWFRQAQASWSDILLSETDLSLLYNQVAQLETATDAGHVLYSEQAGWMPTRSLGGGMDYAESRLYQQGDDRKLINWRLSARSQETFIKTYHKESRPNICILLDLRSSMLFGTRRRLKITQAMRAVALLAMAAKHYHLGLNNLILADGISWTPDLQLEELLLEMRKPIYSAQTTSAVSGPSLKSALLALNQFVSKGSLVYVISDYIDLDQSDQALLAQLNEHCYVQALHIMDRAELQLAQWGELRLQSHDGQQKIMINTLNDKARKQFNHDAKKQAEHKQQLITDLGIHYSRLMTESDELYPFITMPLGFN